jgi:hypothetical protein
MTAVLGQQVLSLHDLLVVEDDSRLLAVKCEATGLPLWPQIRTVFLRALMSDLLYGSELTGRSAARVPVLRAASTLARSQFHNLRIRLSGALEAKVCIFGDGVADQWVEGRWFNRLVDRFATQLPAQTLVVADHFEWRWPFPRHHSRMFAHAPMQARSAVAGRLMRGPWCARAREVVGLAVERSQQRLGWVPGPEREARMVDMLAAKAAALPRQFEAYERLLRRVRPRVLLVGAACYGPASALVAAARRLGIVTAEYQHGAVSAGHDGYNFAPSVLADPAYHETLPEYFLGYGQWWNEQINAPVKKIVIGNPHRTERIAAMEGLRMGGTAPNASDLLILSDGIEFDLYLDLARSVQRAARRKGLRVRLRPHPLERSVVAAMPAAALQGIEIDTDADLYRSLQTARIVVSEVSTGLFEAVGVAARVLLWDTPKARFGYPVHPFDSFTDAASLESLIERDEGTPLGLPQVESIWASDWQGRYRAFLKAHGSA